MSVVRLLLNKTPATLLKTGLRLSTVNAARLVQLPNAETARLVTLLGIVTLARLVQYWNATPSMLVTLLPIVRFVRLVQEKNA